jgi:coenzyme Q-binding protein COQ10
MAHIHKSILIHAPVDKVYGLARDPERWNAWWVGLSEPEEVKGRGETGTIVKHNYTMAGLTFPVTSQVLEDKRDDKKAQWRGKIEGPFAGQHEWTYIAKGSDTEVTTDIDYTVPGKALGKIADKLVVERLQEKSTEHTLENLKLLCESAPTARA